MFDQIESVAELWQDASPLSRDAFMQVMQQLDTLERKGYFTFVKGGMDIADRVVTSFTEEDVKQLGENIVLIRIFFGILNKHIPSFGKVDRHIEAKEFSGAFVGIRVKFKLRV